MPVGILPLLVKDRLSNDVFVDQFGYVGVSRILFLGIKFMFRSVNCLSILYVVLCFVTLCLPFKVGEAQQSRKLPKHIFWGHDAWISSVAFAPDGEIIASGSNDKTIKLWSLSGQNEIATLEGHQGGVTSIAFSPDGRFIASASNDKTVKMWSVEAQKEIATFVGHRYGVEALAFSPNGDVLASGGRDYRIKLWSVADKQLIRTLPRQENILQSLGFSRDGDILASGSVDLRFWSLVEQDDGFSPKMDTAEIVSDGGTGLLVASLPPKTFLTSGLHKVRVKRTGETDQFLVFLDEKNAEVIADRQATFINVEGQELISLYFDEEIKPGMAVVEVEKRDAKTDIIEIEGDGGTGLVWVNLPPVTSLMLGLHEIDVEKAEVDGQFVAILDGSKSVPVGADGTVTFIDSDGREILALGFSEEIRPGTAFVEYLVVMEETGHPFTKKEIEFEKLYKGNDWIWSLDFSPDGEFLTFGLSDNTVRLWSVGEKKEIVTLTGHTSDVSSVAFSPDGRVIASGSRELTVWSIAGKAEMATLKLDNNYIHSLAFSPDGSLVVTGTNNGEILIWDMSPFVDPTIVKFVVREATFENLIAEVRAENAKDLYGYQFAIGFNAEVLEVENVSQGNFLKESFGWAGGDETHWIAGEINNEDGKVSSSLGIRIIPGEVKGSGVLATITFIPKKTDESELKFTELKLSNENGDSVVSYSVNQIVQIPSVISADLVVTASIEGPLVVAELKIVDPVNVDGYSVDLLFPDNLEIILEEGLNVHENVITGLVEDTTFKFQIYQSGEIQFELLNGFLDGPLKTTELPVLVNDQITVIASPDWDINRDYVIDIFDLVVLGENFGRQITRDLRPNPDVDGDGVVDVYDFVRVGTNFGRTYDPISTGATLAVARLGMVLTDQVNIEFFKGVLDQIKRHPLTDMPDFVKTRQLLLDLIRGTELPPSETRLLPNYPNPFNPETWIPFELAGDASVIIRIYDQRGNVIRRMDVGYRPAGRYVTSGKAVYWDGKNNSGESLSSGTYFYQISAGGDEATRKMMILK